MQGQAPLFAARAPQTPKRPMPLRARRRRVRAAIALGVFIVLFALGYGIHYISYLPQFNIQTITVAGTKDVSPQLVSDYVQTILNDGSYHLLSRSNILLYPRMVIEKDVAGYFPRIASAAVSRPSMLSTNLAVTVTERQTFALWCVPPASCYQIDSGGFIFAETPTTTATSTEYVFQGSVATTTSPIGQTFVPAHLPALVALLTQLGQSGFTPLGASVENDTDFSVPLVRGYFVKASFGENASTLVKNLQLVLASGPLQGNESKLEYIDLRFGDRVYYKLLGQTQASSTPQ